MQARLLTDTETEYNGIPITFPEDSMIRDIDVILPGSGSEIIEDTFYSFEDPMQITKEELSKAICDAILNASKNDYDDEYINDNDNGYNDNELFQENSVSIVGSDDFGQFVILKQVPAEDILFIPENKRDQDVLPALKEFIPNVKWLNA